MESVKILLEEPIILKLKIETEEVADFIFLYNDKNVCVHLDYLQYPFSRSIKIVGKKGILKWSFADSFIEIIKINKSKKIFFPKTILKIICF